MQTTTMLGTALTLVRDGDVELYVGEGDEGAFTVAATYRPNASHDARRWHAAMFVLRVDGPALVAEGYGSTREKAERALTVQLAALLRIGVARAEVA